MTRVFATTYYELRSKWPNAFMIKATPGGYEGYVTSRTTQDARYSQHHFMDKG